MTEDGKRPTEIQVARMWNHNDHGGGAAWRADGRVHWLKGQTEEQMQELAKTLPFPYILHFRIASIGGQRPELTHPFVAIDDFEQSLALKGDTDHAVVFHNGHWNEWHDKLMIGCGVKGEQMPRGPWSDSRAMAWLYRYYGMGFLDTLGQRTVVLTPDRLDFGIGGGWDKKDGIWYSNTVWDYIQHATSYQVCRKNGCYVSINLSKDGYCPIHINGGGTQKVTQMTQVTGPKGVDQTQIPFDPSTQWIQAELAWALEAAGVLDRDQARSVCSKNQLKRMREAWERQQRKALHASRKADTAMTIVTLP